MSRKQFTAVVLSATVFLGFLAYANTFTGDWVWDDVSSVLLHENVQQPNKFFQLFREDQHAFGRGQGSFFRPLVSASFMLDFWVSYSPTLDGTELKGYPDVKPFFFHLTNILWHITAAILLFFLLARLQAPRIIQAVVPMLFVLHPMHTEAVAYISGRADMMSATFILGALLCASTDASGTRRIMLTLGSGLLFAFGLCSKESSLIYPVLLTLVILLRPQPDGRSPDKAVWKARSLPLLLTPVILIAYFVWKSTMVTLGTGGGGGNTRFFQRLVETCQAFAFYIKTLFVPTGLHMEQTLAGTPVWTAALGLLCLLLILGLSIWTFRRGHRRITLGFVWFLAAWLPISGLYPLNAPMAEHWMYVPMVGFWWATLELLLLFSKRIGTRLLVPGLATALALLFLFGTVHRNRDWRNNETLFRATLAENPDTIRVHTNLATTYDYLEGNLPGARRHYEAVLAQYTANAKNTGGMLPDEIPIRLSLAEVLLRQGAYQEAMRHYGRLVSLAKNEAYKAEAAKAALGMGECLLAVGNYGQASQALQQAMTLEPALGRQAIGLLRGAPLPRGR